MQGLMGLPALFSQFFCKSKIKQSSIIYSYENHTVCRHFRHAECPSVAVWRSEG